MIELAARDQGVMRARVESGLESLRHFEALLEAEGLQDCYRPVGKYVAAFAPDHLKGLARRAEWASANTPLRAEALSRREAPAELGSDFYHGGVRFGPGGLIQPAFYLQGLLERTRAKVRNSLQVGSRRRRCSALPAGHADASGRLGLGAPDAPRHSTAAAGRSLRFRPCTETGALLQSAWISLARSPSTPRRDDRGRQGLTVS